MKKFFVLLLGISSLNAIQAKQDACMTEVVNMSECGTTVIAANKHHMNPHMYVNHIALQQDNCGQVVASVQLMPNKCATPCASVAPAMSACYMG